MSELEGHRIEHLDGDIVRKSLTKDLGFSPEDRRTNLERVTFVAKLLARHGVVVLCSFVSPSMEVRNQIRKEIEADGSKFIEVFVDCIVEECERRDVKGMYKLAREGKIQDFTGIDAPYEQPLNPEIVVKTQHNTTYHCTATIERYLRYVGLLHDK
jgi:adenylyl-sulfate kinase